MTTCNAHPDLMNKLEKMDTTQDQMKIDLEIIKTSIMGNGQEGITKKVDRHDKFMYMFTGAFMFVAWALERVWSIK